MSMKLPVSDLMGETMSRKKTEPKPNYELLFKSAVTALQVTYNSWKAARIKEIRMSWFGDDGNYCEFEGVGEIRIQASNLLHDIQRLQKEVEKYRRLMEGEKDETD